MADEKAITIDSVTTLVAELPGMPLDQALAKFQGTRTVRTLNAARRMAEKKRVFKIPRNLLRQIFRGTGGFRMEAWKASPNTPVKGSDRYPDLLAVQVGDLEVVFGQSSDSDYYGPICWLAFRGQWVAAAVPAYNNAVWLQKDKAWGYAKKLGVPFGATQK